ncbi:MAG: thermonuclease family protein [Candidatus Polarisedimenticolaceae bacterium]|nr:thermonuclease family protein [Candidatus Polarisedimenticolaceae bacterium]
MVRSLCVVRVAVAVMLLAPCAVFADVTWIVKGDAKVIDARTLEINGQQVVMREMDAPDLDQICFTKKEYYKFRCGVVAAEKLTKLIANNPLSCEGAETDDKGRLLATCWVGEAPQRIDLNQQAVLSGWAVYDPAQSERYKSVQVVARQLRQGLWRAKFVMPWEWRSGNHEPPKENPPYNP